MAEKKNQIESTDKAVGWLEKLARLEKKYGFFGIVRLLLLILMLGYVIYFISNPEFLFNKFSEMHDKRHSELVTSRLHADSEINTILVSLLYHTGSSRTWVIEFHNGSSNLASGLPFLYGSMTYEAIVDDVYSVLDEYSDFPLSHYPLITTMLGEGYWYGAIDELKPIDTKLYHKFVANGVTNAALLTLYSGEKLLGVLGITYCDGEPDWKQCGIEIRRAGVQIATILTRVK